MDILNDKCLSDYINVLSFMDLTSGEGKREYDEFGLNQRIENHEECINTLDREYCLKLLEGGEYENLWRYVEKLVKSHCPELEAHLYTKIKSAELFHSLIGGDSRTTLKIFKDVEEKLGYVESQKFNTFLTFKSPSKELMKKKGDLEKFLKTDILTKIPSEELSPKKFSSFKKTLNRGLRERIRRSSLTRHGFELLVGDDDNDDKEETTEKPKKLLYECTECGNVEDDKERLSTCLECGSHVHYTCIPKGYLLMTSDTCKGCNPIPLTTTFNELFVEKEDKDLEDIGIFPVSSNEKIRPPPPPPQPSREEEEEDNNKSEQQQEEEQQQKPEEDIVPPPPPPPPRPSEDEKKEEGEKEEEEKIVAIPTPTFSTEKKLNRVITPEKSEYSGTVTPPSHKKKKKKKKKASPTKLVEPLQPQKRSIHQTSSKAKGEDPVLPSPKRVKRDGQSSPKEYVESPISIDAPRNKRVVQLLPIPGIPDFLVCVTPYKLFGISLTKPRNRQQQEQEEEGRKYPVWWSFEFPPSYFSRMEQCCFSRVTTLDSKKYIVSFLTNPKEREKKFPKDRKKRGNVSREYLILKEMSPSGFVNNSILNKVFREDISFVGQRDSKGCMDRSIFRFQTFDFISDDVAVFVKKNGRITFFKFCIISDQHTSLFTKKLRIKRIKHDVQPKAKLNFYSNVYDMKISRSHGTIYLSFVAESGEFTVHTVKPRDETWESVVIYKGKKDMDLSRDRRYGPLDSGCISHVEYGDAPNLFGECFVANFRGTVGIKIVGEQTQVDTPQKQMMLQEQRKEQFGELSKFGQKARLTHCFDCEVIEILPIGGGYITIVGKDESNMKCFTRKVYVSSCFKKMGIDERKKIESREDNYVICSSLVKCETGGKKKIVFGTEKGLIFFQ